LVDAFLSIFGGGGGCAQSILTIGGYFSCLQDGLHYGFAWIWIYAAFFTSIWLWLYAGSGFLLKAIHRLDLGFGWFNRTFDIEKKPLQSIGLVAGALVALAYWGVVIVRKVL